MRLVGLAGRLVALFGVVVVAALVLPGVAGAVQPVPGDPTASPEGWVGIARTVWTYHADKDTGGSLDSSQVGTHVTGSPFGLSDIRYDRYETFPAFTGCVARESEDVGQRVLRSAIRVYESPYEADASRKWVTVRVDPRAGGEGLTTTGWFTICDGKRIEPKIEPLLPLPQPHELSCSAPADATGRMVVPVNVQVLRFSIECGGPGRVDKTQVDLRRADCDASVDSDADGLPDCREYDLGTDPLNPDTDGDGVKDGVDGCPVLPAPGTRNGCPGECPTGAAINAAWRPWTLQLDLSVDVADGGADLRYFWSFGDGQTATTELPLMTHVYGAPAVVEPSVTVTSASSPNCPPVGASTEIAVDPIDLYAPSIKFHPREKYFGGDPNDFLAASKLRWEQKRQDDCPKQGSPSAVVADTGQVNPAWLAGSGGAYVALGVSEGCDAKRVFAHDRPSQAGSVDENGYGFVLDAPKSVRRGNTSSPLYAEYVDPAGKSPYVLYWLWYPHNEWKSVCVKGPFSCVREIHEGDWEHVVVQLDQDDLKAKRVAFYRHYCVADVRSVGSVDRDSIDPTHFLVYAALGGHASYAEGKRAPQTCKLPSYDETATRKGSGRFWRPWQVGPIRDATLQPWYGFGGQWGDNSIFSTQYSLIDNYGPNGPGPIRSKQQDTKKEGGAIPKGWG